MQDRKLNAPLNLTLIKTSSLCKTCAILKLSLELFTTKF